MTTDTPTTEVVVDPAAKGLNPGVPADALDDGQQRTAGAPVPPVVSNEPPPKTKEQLDAEKAKIADADAAAAKAADDAKKPPENKDEKKDDKAEDEPLKDYPDYKDEAANSAVKLLVDAGITIQEADALFRPAVEADDLSKVDVAKLTEKVGKDKATLIMIGLKDFYGRQQAETKKSLSVIYDAVGGEANWALVKAWSVGKSKTDPAHATKVAELNAMFDLNPTAAGIAAKEIRGLYEADPGNKSLQIKMVEGDKTGSSVGVGEKPMTRTEYVAALEAANNKGDHAEMQRLRSVRKATRQSP